MPTLVSELMPAGSIPASVRSFPRRFLSFLFLVGAFSFIFASQAFYRESRFPTASPIKTEEDSRSFPLIYGTLQYMRESQYQMLSYPYTDLAPRSYAIVPDAVSDFDHTATLPAVTELNTDWLIPNSTLGASYIRPIDQGYQIGTKEDLTLHLTLPDSLTANDSLYLSFDMINLRHHQGTSVTVNGQTHLLPKSYYIGLPTRSNLNFAIPPGKLHHALSITFAPGNYQLYNLKLYAANCASFENPKLCQDPMKLLSVGFRTLKGEIDCMAEEFAITRLPYKKDFQVEIDGKEISFFRVNQDFLGFIVPKGRHTIEISYRPKIVFLADILTLTEILMLLSFCSIYKDSSLQRPISRKKRKLRTRN